MNSYKYTTQQQVRNAFWQEHEGLPGISSVRTKDYSGKGTMHNTDTRVAFVDFVDHLSKNGDISDKLADSVTLS